METTSQPQSRLTHRIWFVLTLLAITGQIAWAVENSLFNTFVYDMLTPDPRAVAWMVGVSAVTATLTPLFMGTLSDRTRSRKEKWGPMSKKAKRQQSVFAIFFFGVMIGAMVYTVIHLEQMLGTPPSFLAIFVSIVILLATFNLVDAIIIDWLILMVLWPGLVVLPGTEGMAGYKDKRLWTKNFLKGFIFAPIAGLLVAGISFILYR